MGFSEGLERINRFAFSETDLAGAVFPASLRTISQGAFSDCKSLKTVIFNEGLETLGTNEYADSDKLYQGVFENSALQNVELPVTLKRIEYSAFENCASLKNIVLPRKLEYVGKRCF